MDQPALDLAFHDHGIDDAAAVVDDCQLLDAHDAGLHVHVDHRGHHAEAPGDGRRDEVVGLRAARVHALGQAGARTRRGRAVEVTQAHASRGDAPRPDLAIDELEVLGLDLEHLGGDALQPLLKPAGGDVDGGAGRDDAAGGERTHAIGDERGVARPEDDLLGRDAEEVGHHLGHRRLQALSVRRAARIDDNIALGVDLDLRTLERPHARALDVGAEPDPAPDALHGRFRAPPAVSFVLHQLENLLERRGEADGVVEDVRAVPVRHTAVPRLIRVLDEVAPDDLSRIEVEAPRHLVDHAVHHERRLGPAGAPIGQVEHLVGQDAFAGEVEVADRVHAPEVRGDVVGAAQRVGTADAGVEEEAVADGQDLAFRVEGRFDLVQLVAGVGGRDQVLLAVLHPAHWLADDPGDVAEQHLFGIDLDLAAEAAADVGRDHPHLPFGHADPAGDRVANYVRDLG